ncbi:UDP-N-acetylmuramoyl-tripeptide--D-alanyl-D-alanine ligase [Candidatus Saccharibacteria bacterium]|nr:MAG: UDP-N-acetylmuramoyl-tripeptide--D-alanyl-D-alanine ligase [Candidatus Saccharibacteria bacterium]
MSKLQTYGRVVGRLYSWSFPRTLVGALKQHNYSAWRYFGWLLQTKTFAVPNKPLRLGERCLAWLLGLGMLLQIVAGFVLVVEWARTGDGVYWPFGLALLVSYPLTWGFFLGLEVAVWHGLYFLVHPKKAGRSLVCTVLEGQVVKLRAKHKFTVVAVAGSVGKTSTKLAIANLLGQTKRVRYQTGNYNDRVTVPLIFFGQEEPSLFNISAWLKVFSANNTALGKRYPYDVVVIEIGTDGPGYMKEFAYIRPDVTVVTAITPEHMEYFETLDAVAAEELAVFDYSRQVLVNGDDVPGMYLVGREFSEYSVTADEATYYAKPGVTTAQGQKLALRLGKVKASAQTQYLGEQGAKIVLAAASVAAMLEVSPANIAAGIPKLEAFAGRMQLLQGVKGALLIDDTYNASPVAVNAALDVLYGLKAKQRIAILGSMNELGAYSPEAHREVGAYCDPNKLDLVVTIGADALQYLAPEAEARGCTVHTCMSPYEAGEYVLKHLQEGAVILAKGSQNGVFAEEALKALLANPADASKLVRQSAYWLSKKRQQFTDAPDA